jgi:hypothetical protein
MNPLFCVFVPTLLVMLFDRKLLALMLLIPELFEPIPPAPPVAEVPLKVLDPDVLVPPVVPLLNILEDEVVVRWPRTSKLFSAKITIAKANVTLNDFIFIIAAPMNSRTDSPKFVSEKWYYPFC